MLSNARILLNNILDVQIWLTRLDPIYLTYGKMSGQG